MHNECFPKRGWKVLGAIADIMASYKAVLAGGTALALHIGHRESVDLDFFTGVPFRVDSFIAAIRKSGLAFRILSEGQEHVIVAIDDIKVSLFLYDYPFIGKVSQYKGVRVAGILDIAAMKAIAISQRGTKRDFVDMYLILQNLPFHKIAKHMVQRFGKERVNPILIGKSLVYFADAESNPDPKYKGAIVEWDKVKGFFKTHVKQFVLDLSAAVSE
jgi:hypothetical protein